MQYYFNSTYSWDPSSSHDNENNPNGVDILTIINSGDLSQFVFDSTSGYYYHAASGLYYHPSSNYYWDSFNSTYYNFDTQTQKYVLYNPQSTENPKNETKKTPKKEIAVTTKPSHTIYAKKN